MTDPRSLFAVETAERFADGLASADELRQPKANAERACRAGDDREARVRRAAYAVADSPWAVNHQLLYPKNRLGDRKQQASLLNDIFGNPFRSLPAIDPTVLAWNDGTVRKLAQGIYDERAFDRLTVLADALEEAGCSDPDILRHCRQPGEHVRGCWVLDLLLGKS
jgi:hypothetical protein